MTSSAAVRLEGTTWSHVVVGLDAILEEVDLKPRPGSLTSQGCRGGGRSPKLTLDINMQLIPRWAAHPWF